MGHHIQILMKDSFVNIFFGVSIGRKRGDKDASHNFGEDVVRDEVAYSDALNVIMKYF